MVLFVDKTGDFKALVHSYMSLTLLQRRFFPREIGDALSLYQQDTSSENALAICRAVCNTWLIENSVYPSLIKFINSPLMKAIWILHKDGLLTGNDTQQNFNAVVSGEDYPGGGSSYEYLAQCLSTLKKFNQLTDYHRDALVTCRRMNDLPSALDTLHQNRILNTYNYDAVVKSLNPIRVACELTKLHKCGVLKENESIPYKDAFLRMINIHVDHLMYELFPKKVVTALSDFHRLGLLIGEEGQANLALLESSPERIATLIVILIQLHEVRLLTPENRDNVRLTMMMPQFTRRRRIEPAELATRACPQTLLENLYTLKQIGLLTPEEGGQYFEVATRAETSVNLKALPEIFDRLKQLDLLTPDNRKAILKSIESGGNSYKLDELDLALNYLEGATLLSGLNAQSNFSAVVNHSNKKALYQLLTYTIYHSERGQRQFDAMVACPHPEIAAHALSMLYILSPIVEVHSGYIEEVLITHSDILLHPIWNDIPHRMLTTQCYARIVNIAQEYRERTAEGRDVFARYVREELVRFQRPHRNLNINAQPVFNNSQSTHTASVHHTVSKSAKKLALHYQHQILGANLEKHLTALGQWLKQLPANDKNAPAKRCFNSLQKSNYHFGFTDPVSQVSTKQLLALCWIAIHDTEHLDGTLADAQLAFVNGLYEANREYNLSETGSDRENTADSPACTSGTFNKLISTLWGRHPDVTIQYMTKQTFTDKLNITIKEEAEKYLIEADKAILLGEDVEVVIWNAIKSKVTERLSDEFKSLFENNRNNVTFNDVIDGGGDGFDFKLLIAKYALPGKGEPSVEGDIKLTINELRATRILFFERQNVPEENPAEQELGLGIPKFNSSQL